MYNKQSFKEATIVFQWLKNYYQKSLKDLNSKIKNSVKESHVWHINKESIARGVGIGLFIAFIPIMPFQTILIIFLSILLRANFAIAFAVSWVSNPLTIIPLAYFTYLVGEWILGQHDQVFLQNGHLQNKESAWISFSNLTQQFGKAFFIGMPILAFGVGLIGYILVLILWNVIPSRYKKNK